MRFLRLIRKSPRPKRILTQTEWERKCPICGNPILYHSLTAYYNGIRNNARCHECVKKARKGRSFAGSRGMAGYGLTCGFRLR